MASTRPTQPWSRSLFAITLAILPLGMTGCETMFFSESYMNSLGATAYVDATKDFKEVTGTADAQMVHQVGRDIAKACGKNYQWEFKLLQAPSTVNAFCLPGGKIAVYSGLLPLTQNKHALAAVMGHEVAHATLQHGNKRMSQGILVQAGLVGAQVLLSQWKKADNNSKAAIMAALGAGASIGVVLPYGRSHESEADEVGLRYLIRAGYDPNEAPKLWERMAAKSAERGPEFLSTHPDPLNRAKRLRALIPKLLAEERGQK